MTMDRDKVIKELLGHAEAAVEHFAPALGELAVASLPLVKKGFAYVLMLIEKQGHKDAERILDELLAKPAARMHLRPTPIPADGPDEPSDEPA
jgi:hypothetical protein